MNYLDTKLMVHADRLFPICRSLTGDGVRQTLSYFEDYHPEFERLKFESGSQVFDWQIPHEWNIKDAYIEHIDSKQRFALFTENNLHVVGYSEAVDKIISLDDLLPHIYSDPNMPDAIPYVTSYYKSDWGFCLSHNQKESLPFGQYRAFIDSSLAPGSLELSHAIFTGQRANEIFFSSYICHPSMANNELSGPIVLAGLMDYLKKTYPNPKNTYRFVLLPETIGSIAYLSRFGDYMQNHTLAGFNLSCVGDNRAFSIVHSPFANTLADKALNSVLSSCENVHHYSFLDRGSDERQYCAPPFRLPLCTFCRSKFGTYPEYHTSYDDLSVISEAGLQGSLSILAHIVDAFELGLKPLAKVCCEPQLGKRGLYSLLSKKGSSSTESRHLLNILTYADGEMSVFDIAEICHIPLGQLVEYITTLVAYDLIGFNS